MNIPTRITAAAALSVAFLLVAAPAFATGGGHDPIIICHKGDSIVIDDSAWPGHKAHGDTKGACPCAPAPTVTVTAPGPETTTTVEVPGPETTVTLPGSTTTVTAPADPAATVTITAPAEPAPTVTITETTAPEPAPTVTETVTLPAVTETAVVETPGPTVTATVEVTPINLIDNRTFITATVTAKPKAQQCKAELAKTGGDGGLALLWGLGFIAAGVIAKRFSRKGAHEE